MDAHNLAVVFGPTLFRIPSEQDMIAYQSQVNGMIELLIKHSGEVFPGSGESLREKLSDTEDGSDSEEGKNVEFVKRKKKGFKLVCSGKCTKGAFHLPELTGQSFPVAMIISLSIKTVHPDQIRSDYRIMKFWSSSELIFRQRVLRVVINYARISKLLSDAVFTWRPTYQTISL